MSEVMAPAGSGAAPPPEPAGAGEGAGRNRTLYRAVWRWHFYAGLFAIPVIVLLSITGIIYLFKPQLNSLMYGDLMKVTPAAQAVPYEVQLQAVKDRYPGAEIASFQTPDKPNRSTQFSVTTAEGEDRAVWVNPYTGDVLGSRGPNNLVQIALELHGTLVTGDFLTDKVGTWGDAYIEIVAGWTIVMLVTGIYLWWPRGKRRNGLGGILRPRWKLRGKRTFWRDVHAVTGVLFAFITFFFMITGLMWTGVWGAKYADIATKVDGYVYPDWGSADVPSTVGELLPNGASPWIVSHLPLQSPSQAPVVAGPQVGTAVNSGGTLSWAPGAKAPLDAVVHTAATELGPGSLNVLLPVAEAAEKGSYIVGYWYDGDGQENRNALDLKTVYIDQYSAKLLLRNDFADASLTGQISDFGINLHEGRTWGIWSQLLALAATLALLVSVASSLVMWRKRRPKGLGAPRAEPDRRIGWSIIAVMVGLGILFPLLGLSMVAILLVEFLILRRIPRLARAFGLTAADPPDRPDRPEEQPAEQTPVG